jgi:SAM-dependent methyltransferase
MLARLVLCGLPDEDIRGALDAHPGAGALRAFFDSRVDALRQLRATLAQVNHAGAAGISSIAAQFDRAVARGAEASVAAYSLCDPALLDAATAEIIDWLRAEGLFRAGMDVLDLGCGFGRVAAVLARTARSVLALDISRRMIAEARRRFGTLPRLRFAVTRGANLRFLPAASLDLAIAVDTFPYLFQAGAMVARSHFADCGRALRPSGALVVLNLSYRPDAGDDLRQAFAWAESAHLHLDRPPFRPFTLWDGEAFVFLRGA